MISDLSNQSLGDTQMKVMNFKRLLEIEKMFELKQNDFFREPTLNNHLKIFIYFYTNPIWLGMSELESFAELIKIPCEELQVFASFVSSTHTVIELFTRAGICHKTRLRSLCAMAEVDPDTAATIAQHVSSVFAFAEKEDHRWFLYLIGRQLDLDEQIEKIT